MDLTETQASDAGHLANERMRLLNLRWVSLRALVCSIRGEGNKLTGRNGRRVVESYLTRLSAI